MGKMTDKRTLKVKFKNKVFELEVENSHKVEDVKKQLKEKIDSDSSVPESDKLDVKEMKFIYSGKFLSDSETVKDCKVTEDGVVFLAGMKRTATTAPKKTTFAKEQPTNPMNQAMNMNQPMGQASPMMSMNAINDPTFQRQLDQFIEHPEMLDSFLGVNAGSMSDDQKNALRSIVKDQLKNLKEHPEIFQNIATQMYGQQGMPGMRPNFGGMPQMNPMMGMNPMQQQQPMGSPGMYPMGQNMYNQPQYPNMWNPYGNPYFYQQPMPFYNVPPQNTQTAEDENAKYEFLSKRLEEMGFPDKEANLKALKASKGDINEAIEKLVGGKNQKNDSQK